MYIHMYYAIIRETEIEKYSYLYKNICCFIFLREDKLFNDDIQLPINKMKFHFLVRLMILQ